MSIKKSLVVLTWWFILITQCASRSTSSDATTTHDEEMRKARLMAKPWLMRSLEVGGVDIWVSPASLITFFFFVVQIYYAFFVGTRKFCEASHILIKDTTSPKIVKNLEAMVKDIGGNAKKFGEIAAKYSQCPSKVKNGDLGRFYEGDMAPAFDKICFDPTSKIGTTLGPVQTQFGYHLIYIRQRNI
jgi:peptidyl-prolyl cis-trans isomerase C